MSIQGFSYNYDLRRKLVDQNGVPFQDGRDLLLALFNRTGAGTGIIPKVSPVPLIATGSTIADALGLVTDWNLIGIVAAGTGVAIPPLKPGNDIEVFNGGANALKVYPFSSTAQIDALGNGAAFSLAPGKLRIFQCWTLSLLISYGN